LLDGASLCCGATLGKGNGFHFAGALATKDTR